MVTRILSTDALPNAIRCDGTSFAAIGYGLEVALPAGVQNGDTWEIEVTPFTTPNHLASTILGDDVFISNEQELLSIIKGNLVQCGNSDYGTYDFLDKAHANLNFRSEKIVTYFNHIFIAVGRTLWWTDLDNYWNWFPAVDSEADFRNIEWEKEDITGLCVLDDILYIHFPTCIYECIYTGKPTIVRILKRVSGAGSISSRGIAVTKSAMFFIGPDNFYIWANAKSGLQEIGQEVWKRFVSEHPDPTQTWAYHDLRNHEICWVNSNRIWAFNYVEGHWTKYSADGILDHSSAAWHGNFKSISTSTTDSIIEPDYWRGIENLWVGCWGVARESRLKDNMAERLPMESPMLETDDLTYGDVHSYKTADLVVLDVEVKEPWYGVHVFTAGKARMSAKPVWSDWGVWTPGMEHRDAVAVSGKALRFRFVLVDNLIKADGSLTLNGGQQLTGKRLDTFDGSVILDGTRTVHTEDYYVDNSEGERWGAEVYAWGERVNLPERLVGPDK